MVTKICDDEAVVNFFKDVALGEEEAPHPEEGDDDYSDCEE